VGLGLDSIPVTPRDAATGLGRGTRTWAGAKLRTELTELGMAPWTGTATTATDGEEAVVEAGLSGADGGERLGWKRCGRCGRVSMARRGLYVQRRTDDNDNGNNDDADAWHLALCSTSRYGDSPDLCRLGTYVCTSFCTVQCTVHGAGTEHTSLEARLT
jgi:hypothetical protein